MDTTPPTERKKVVAIQYNADEDDAPRVVAKGQGAVAEQILKLAEKYKIPMYQDPDLVEVLAKIDVPQTIPPEMYQAVAEVLAFVYRMNNRFGSR